MAKALTLANVDVSIRKTNKPYWDKTEKFKAFSKKQFNEQMQGILNKYGRVSKGSYQYSIKIFEYDIITRKGKSICTIVSNWKGTLGEVEKFLNDHVAKHEFVDNLITLIEKEVKKRIKKE